MGIRTGTYCTLIESGEGSLGVEAFHVGSGYGVAMVIRFYAAQPFVALCVDTLEAFNPNGTSGKR